MSRAALVFNFAIPLTGMVLPVVLLLQLQVLAGDVSVAGILGLTELRVFGTSTIFLAVLGAVLFWTSGLAHLRFQHLVMDNFFSRHGEELPAYSDPSVRRELNVIGGMLSWDIGRRIVLASFMTAGATFATAWFLELFSSIDSKVVAILVSVAFTSLWGSVVAIFALIFGSPSLSPGRVCEITMSIASDPELTKALLADNRRRIEVKMKTPAYSPSAFLPPVNVSYGRRQDSCKLTPREGNTPLSPREIAQRLRSQFGFVDESSQEAAAEIDGRIKHFTRVGQGDSEFCKELIAEKDGAIQFIVADEKPGRFAAQIRFLATSAGKPLSVYCSWPSENTARWLATNADEIPEQGDALSLVERCADALGYDVR